LNALLISRHGLRVGWQDLGAFWNPFTWVGGWVVRILAQAAFFAMLGELLHSPERLNYLLIGNVVMMGALSSYIAVRTTTWDRGEGTYPLLVISPSSMLPALIGRTFIWAINGLLTSTVALLVLAPIFDLELVLPWVLFAPLLLGLTSASTFCMALLLGSLVALKPRLATVVGNLTTSFSMAFCGVSVPVSFWPGWVEALANVTPITHGLRAFRLLLDQAPAGDIVTAAGLEVVIGSFWLCVAMLVVDRMADAGRADGSIELA
jgi:ABC-2 type transport system permease protein